jgi:hypothetical protein
MFEPGIAELRKSPEYLLLLEAYRDDDAAARESNPEFDGWLPRVNRVDGIDDDSMSRAHGRMICFGFLKFRLGDRLEGMKYQLGQDAARILNGTYRASGSDPDDEQDDDLSLSA